MKIVDYQQLARTTAIYPRKHKIIYPALGLAGEAGEVCEKIKKTLRGDKDPEFREKITKELGDVMWYIANLATDLNLDLNEVALANLKKLHDRKKRGVLRGSGDKR